MKQVLPRHSRCTSPDHCSGNAAISPLWLQVACSFRISTLPQTAQPSNLPYSAFWLELLSHCKPCTLSKHPLLTDMNAWTHQGPLSTPSIQRGMWGLKAIRSQCCSFSKPSCHPSWQQSQEMLWNHLIWFAICFWIIYQTILWLLTIWL